MSKFTYSCDIGGYDQPVHIDIDVKLAHGLSKESYQQLKDAFEVIEAIGLDCLAPIQASDERDE